MADRDLCQECADETLYISPSAIEMFIDVCENERIVAEFSRLQENLDDGIYPRIPDGIEDEPVFACYDARLNFEPALELLTLVENAPPYTLLASVSNNITNWIYEVYGNDIWDHVVYLDDG